jgi:2-hydroxy-3-oxopropionate reductase
MFHADEREREPSMSALHVGFIGLGLLGLPMAKCLARGGFGMTVFDLRQDAIDELVALGAQPASSCKALAQASDVVITMVRDIPQTDEVLFGADGAWDGLRQGSVVVLMNTLSPAYCRSVYERGKERGIHVVDAPVAERLSMPNTAS